MKNTILVLLVILVSGCAELSKIMQATPGTPISEEEVINGLKEALILGSGNTCSVLSAENGYYGDAAVKILLPPEAGTIIDNISKIPGGEKLVEDVIIRINRAAEEAARKAAPIFAKSITDMTIRDAFNILTGPDNAATSYLRSTTWDELYSLYKPEIQSATGKKIVGEISAKNSWITLTDKWNLVANSVAGKVAGLKPVNRDLDDYLTTRGLEGIFSKTEIEELKIRKDISARVTPSLKRVFGYLDNK